MTALWRTDYVDDAATKRVDIRSPGGRLWTGNSNYEPPASGVHLCGQTDDGKQPTTVAVYPMQAGEARRFWQTAREVAMCGRDEADFVVDLCVADSIDDDFWSNRQIWPRAIEAWNTAKADPLQSITLERAP